MNTKTQDTTNQVIDTEVRAQELVKSYADAVHIYNEIHASIQDKLQEMEALDEELENIKSEMRKLGPGSYDGFDVRKAPMKADLDEARERLSERSLKALRPDSIDRKKLKALFPNVHNAVLKPGTASVIIK